MVCQQRFAFGEISLGARQLEFSRIDDRVVLVRRRSLLAHLPHGLCQRARHAAQAGLRIDGIESHQYLARLDQLRVVGLHGDHRAGDLSRDHHLVAVHIGIIGALALRQHQYPVRRP